jgi:hypothetical protein
MPAPQRSDGRTASPITPRTEPLAPQRSDGRTTRVFTQRTDEPAPNATRPVLRAARCEHQAEAKPP